MFKDDQFFCQHGSHDGYFWRFVGFWSGLERSKKILCSLPDLYKAYCKKSGVSVDLRYSYKNQE